MSLSAFLQLHPHQCQSTQSCPLPRIQSPSSTFHGAYSSASKAWLEDEAYSERRARLEQEFTSNFKCCGVQLHDLHTLLEHFETAHQPQSMTLDLDFPSISCPASPLDIEFSTAHASPTAATAFEECIARSNIRATSPEVFGDSLFALPFRPLSPPASPGSIEPLDMVVMPSQFSDRHVLDALEVPTRTIRPPTPVSDHDHLSDAEHDRACDDEPSLPRAVSHHEPVKKPVPEAIVSSTNLCPLPTPAAEVDPLPKPVKVLSNDPSCALPPGVLPIYSPPSIPSFRVDMSRKTNMNPKPLPFPANDLMPATSESSEKTACPVTGCPKKYSSASGLRYHLQHAHDGLVLSLLSKRRKYAPY